MPEHTEQERQMSAFDRLMLALTGREPQGRPQSGADELMLRQRGMQPPQQETHQEGFRRLQREQRAAQQQQQKQGGAEQNMIERALGSLFGGQ